MAAVYAPLLPRLRGPNENETAGQGLWLVPGLFWSFGNGDYPCTTPCLAPPAGPGPQPHHCCKSHGDVPWLTSKMAEYWAYAQRTPQIIGFFPWHWHDAPTLSPPSDDRGAKTLGGAHDDTYPALI
eukprot:COSAG06_NODE_21444_length_756_cov_1.229833_2_plen_126_part_00